jgi:HK97 family phage major capsid protein
MLLTSTNTVAGILPQDWGPLLVEPVQTAARALDPTVSTLVRTASHVFHLPIVNADASASWVAEGAEITPSDPTISELVIIPSKVAGLTIVSSELAHDTSPAAAQVVGDGLARSIAQQIDAAYFGNLSAPAPSGLGALTNTAVNRIVAGTTPANLDAFAQALSLVEQDAAEITSFVANPSDALMIATLKTGSGFNAPLLGTDATNGTARQILGIPLLVTPRVAQGVIWGLSAPRNYVIMREDVSVTTDASVFFTSDRVAVRATMRVGFGFPTPKAIAKIALAAS